MQVVELGQHFHDRHRAAAAFITMTSTLQFLAISWNGIFQDTKLPADQAIILEQLLHEAQQLAEGRPVIIGGDFDQITDEITKVIKMNLPFEFFSGNGRTGFILKNVRCKGEDLRQIEVTEPKNLVVGRCKIDAG